MELNCISFIFRVFLSILVGCILGVERGSKNRPAGGQTNYHFENNARITDRIEIVGVYKGIPVSFAIGENQVSVFSTLADP